MEYMFQKTMYGFFYEKDGKVKYMADAQRGNIYRNICALEESGAFVTPVYSKTYWYNRKTTLASIVESFKNELKLKSESDYIEEIQKLRKEYDENKQARYQQALEQIYERYGAKPAETARRYGYRWGIL